MNRLLIGFAITSLLLFSHESTRAAQSVEFTQQIRPTNDLLWKAVCNNEYKEVQKFLSRGANPNIVYSKQKKVDITILMLAIIKGHLKIANMLLESDQIDILAKGSINGWTAIAWATHHGHTEIVKRLLRMGALKNFSMQYLKCIAESISEEHPEVLQLLNEFEKNASIFAQVATNGAATSQPIIEPHEQSTGTLQYLTEVFGGLAGWFTYPSSQTEEEIQELMAIDNCWSEQ